MPRQNYSVELSVTSQVTTKAQPETSTQDTSHLFIINSSMMSCQRNSIGISQARHEAPHRGKCMKETKAIATQAPFAHWVLVLATT